MSEEKLKQRVVTPQHNNPMHYSYRVLIEGKIVSCGWMWRKQKKVYRCHEQKYFMSWSTQYKSNWYDKETAVQMGTDWLDSKDQTDRTFEPLLKEQI